LYVYGKNARGEGGGGDDERKYSFIVKDVPFGSSKISSYCMHLGAR
jgi:hypothetical protein